MNNNNIIELRCKDRLNCKGRAKYDLDTKITTITKKCRLNNYQDHNYVKNDYIKDKIKNN